MTTKLSPKDAVLIHILSTFANDEDYNITNKGNGVISIKKVEKDNTKQTTLV